jgi:hypothetical protein
MASHYQGGDLRQQLTRSVAEECGAARAVRLGKSFTKWSMDPSGYESRAYPLDADSLDEAAKLCTPGMMPLNLASLGFDPFVILETDERVRAGKARHVLHFYIVKARREWRAVGPLGSARKVAVPYAVHQGSLPMNAFEPRRPFDVAKGDCPATGRQPGEDGLIEVRP